jgi:hypothetical protein
MMMTRLADLMRKPLFVFLASGFIGAIIFIAIYGVSVINPTNTQWLQADMGDLSQHYLGWLFYRQADWTFIIGSIQNLAYPHGLAITYMDSIPLLAIPFKLISFALPDNFQYFGIWGLMSYILQGGIAGLIIMRFTRSPLFAILGSMVLSFSPLVIQRMFSHTALAGHWIVLAGIYLLVRFGKQSRLWVFLVCWSIVLAVSACIHPYFIPMNLALLLMSTTLTFKRFRDLVLRVVVPGIVALFVFFIIGGFSVTDVAVGKASGFGLNADSLINALGWSAFFVNNPVRQGSYEAFAYVGVGVMVVMAILLIALVIFKANRKLKQLLKTYTRPRWIVVYVIGLCVVAAALSPTINVGDYSFAIHIPSSVEKVWSVFRATGRLFWPIYYLLVIGSIVALYKILNARINKKILITLMLVIVALQGFDVTESINGRAKHERFIIADKITYASPLNIPEWNKAIEGKAHIQYIGPVDDKRFFAEGYIAVAHHMTMSDGYFARSPYKAIQQSSADAKVSVLAGKARSDTVYITNDPEVVQFAQASSGLSIFQDYNSYTITTH